MKKATWFKGSEKNERTLPGRRPWLADGQRRNSNHEMGKRVPEFALANTMVLTCLLGFAPLFWTTPFFFPSFPDRLLDLFPRSEREREREREREFPFLLASAIGAHLVPMKEADGRVWDRGQGGGEAGQGTEWLGVGCAVEVFTYLRRSGPNPYACDGEFSWGNRTHKSTRIMCISMPSKPPSLHCPKPRRAPLAAIVFDCLNSSLFSLVPLTSHPSPCPFPHLKNDHHAYFPRQPRVQG